MIWILSGQRDILVVTNKSQIEEADIQSPQTPVLLHGVGSPRRTPVSYTHLDVYTRQGQEMSVLIEGYLYEDDIYIGRTYMDAPKVDGNVFVRAQEELISGDIVPVRITGANEYDLMGDVIYADEFTE